MRWIIDKEESTRLLKGAKECAVYGADKQGARKLACLTFDCVEFHTKKYFDFLRKLMEWSGDLRVYFVVLDPDPVSYYFAHFGKYPFFEIPHGDTGDLYITALNEDPGDSPADAVGTNWYEYAIFPPSKKWFVYGERDARSGEGGHLCVPPEWSDKARLIYPYELY